VVAKTAAPGILHKSDVNGVMLRLGSEEAVATAYDDLAARLGPRVLISAMAKGQAELAFGLVRDEQFGSFVMVAFGGVWIEVLKDSQLAMAPLDPRQASQRIAALKMAKVLEGVRGAPRCDIEALVNAYVNLGRLAADLGAHIRELDINPVLVSERGAIAVDSLIVPMRAAESRHDH
jgi:acyl-CoA synthetase (NDP forming)